jgi:hypothetical protein
LNTYVTPLRQQQLYNTSTLSQHNNSKQPKHLVHYDITTTMTTPTRSTRINRSSIASTLFGLLATIAGAQAQGPQCVCSPREYSVSFDLAQDCDNNNNEIAGLPGILAAVRQSCNVDLIEVNQVQIEEYAPQNLPIVTTFNFDPPVTSGTIEYTSISTKLISGVPLEDQLQFVPLIIRVVLFGNNGNDETVLRDAVAVFYTNECESGPIDFRNSGLGYDSFVSTSRYVYFISTTHYQLEYSRMLIIALTIHIICLTDKKSTLQLRAS